MAFVMRREAVDVFSHARVEDFECRLITHLRTHHAERLSEYDDAAVRAYIRTCLTRAHRLYGLVTEQAVACYAEIPLLLGDDFEVNPAYHMVPLFLADRGVEQSMRAKRALGVAYGLKK